MINKCIDWLCDSLVHLHKLLNLLEFYARLFISRSTCENLAETLAIFIYAFFLLNQIPKKLCLFPHYVSTLDSNRFHIVMILYEHTLFNRPLLCSTICICFFFLFFLYLKNNIKTAWLLLVCIQMHEKFKLYRNIFYLLPVYANKKCPVCQDCTSS